MLDDEMLLLERSADDGRTQRMFVRVVETPHGQRFAMVPIEDLDGTWRRSAV